MILTKQEKEKQILELYNQGYTYKQIAEKVRVSPRDIKPVLKKAEKEREKELGTNSQEGNNKGTENRQTQKACAFSQAYRLFSECKTPLDVAIELNLREPEATRYYRQYWKLRQLHSLYIVYEEEGDDIIHIPKIHRKIRAAGMRVDQAINLIKNNDLSTLERKYQGLKREVNLLESRKVEEYRTLNDLQDEIDASERMLKLLETSCQKEEAKIDQLASEKIRLKRLVKQFKGNDEEYLKIKRTVQNKVTNLLLDGKNILRVALDSLMETMSTDPRKYMNLIYNYKFDNFCEENKTTLLKDAEKLYNKSVKELTEQIISEYSIKNNSSLLFISDK